jgi:hypothetical protein
VPAPEPRQPQQPDRQSLKSTEAAPEFVPCRPKKWAGRYARIPGKTSVFHVRHCDRAWQTVVEWRDGYDTATCTMVSGAAARALATAVCAAKQRAGAGSGGAFQVNEFGQVLVPVSDEAECCVLVGEWHGPLRFENPFEVGRTFDLSSAAGLSAGDPWPMPYVGIPHKLCADGGIAFARLGTLALRPPRQDPQLIYALTRVRGSGGCRFIVTAGGIVLTKAQPPRRSWTSDDGARPVYVGRVDFTRWFAKEA